MPDLSEPVFWERTGQTPEEWLIDNARTIRGGVTMKCNCYVSKLSAFRQFVIRYGAHDTYCPVYKESRDPVDQLKDDYTRLHQGSNLQEV